MEKLEAKERKSVGTKANIALRRKGRIPAVFYGKKEQATPISLSFKEFSRVYNTAGESTVITLSGMGDEKEVLIHDVDFDPVYGVPRHADLYVIEKGKKVRVDVPLDFIGTAPAVKELGGILVKVLHELEIEAVPKDLPHDIKVDTSSLIDFESHITVKDITLPEGVLALTDKDETVALVSEREEEEEKPAEEPDLSSIEVEKKGKEEAQVEEEQKED